VVGEKPVRPVVLPLWSPFVVAVLCVGEAGGNGASGERT
jgi:hypothetical protein